MLSKTYASVCGNTTSMEKSNSSYMVYADFRSFLQGLKAF